MNNPLVRLRFPCALLQRWSSSPAPRSALPTPVPWNPRHERRSQSRRCPSPRRKPIPVVQVAEARGWPAGRRRRPATETRGQCVRHGLVASALAVRAAQRRRARCRDQRARAARRRQGHQGQGHEEVMQAKAGAGVPSANRITLLRDADGDGVAEIRTPLLENLHSPFGMALIGSDLYVANTDAIVKFPYAPGTTKISAAGTKLTDLPGGTRNHHWTKNIIAEPRRHKLYATVGSNSNVAENGMAVEEGRAAIWEVDVKTGAKKLFATGPAQSQRHGVGATDRRVVDGGQRARRARQRSRARLPDVGEGRRVLRLAVLVLRPARRHARGAAAARSGGEGGRTRLRAGRARGGARDSRTRTARRCRAHLANGMFIGEHGSWNRKPPAGYKVVFVPFVNGQPSGMPARRADGFRERERRGVRPAGRRGDRPARRAAGRG